MLNVDDPDFWKQCKKCFVSYPTNVGTRDQNETWFSENHQHDRSAVAREFYYILPIPQPNGESNKLVPVRYPFKNLKYADERGINSIHFDAEEYEGLSDTVIKVV